MISLAAPQIGAEERAAVDRVLTSGRLAQGPEVERFEEDFRTFVARRECVAVSSGTSALHLALLAAGIGPGDEVVLPSFSFAATANAVRLVGAEPVFADISPDDRCLDPDAAAAAVTSRTAAIVAVHLYGQPARTSQLRDIAAQRELLLVEDAAQAHAAVDEGRPVGALGDVAAFSFYPTKNMTTGEGGMVVTADQGIAGRLRLLRNQGQAVKHVAEVVGFNMRMTDVAAAIGRVQLRALPRWNEQRQQNAATLTDGLRAVDGLTVPSARAGTTHVYHQYTIEHPRRDELRRRLAKSGIDSGIYYPVPIHRQPAFECDVALPRTDRASKQVLSLPVHPSLTHDELIRIVEAVHAAMNRDEDAYDRSA